jgi:hypothetical protein
VLRQIKQYCRKPSGHYSHARCKCVGFDFDALLVVGQYNGLGADWATMVKIFESSRIKVLSLDEIRRHVEA